MRFLWETFFLSLLGSIGSTMLTERFIHTRIAILGSFVGLQRSTNSGVAFGLELGLLQPLLIAVATGVVAVMAFRTARTRLSQAGFGLILGGGIANVADRLHDGRVTDLFQVGRFPVFNVADSCITVGVILLLVEVLMGAGRRE